MMRHSLPYLVNCSLMFAEPVSGPKPYPLRTADDAVAVVRRARDGGKPGVAAEGAPR